MAILGNEPDRWMEVNLDEFAKRYTSLADLLKAELAVGSQDHRKVTISLPDGGYEVHALGGTVLSVRRLADTYTAITRVYWTEMEEDHKLKIANLGGSSYSAYKKLHEEGELGTEAMEAVRLAFRQHSISRALELDEQLRSRGSESSTRGDLIHSSLDWDFLKESASSLVALALAEEDRISRYENVLGLAPTVTLSSSVAALTTSDEERFLVEAAKRRSTMADARSLSDGFLWSDILAALDGLVSTKVIDLDGVIESEDEQLPSLDDFEVMEILDSDEFSAEVVNVPKGFGALDATSDNNGDIDYFDENTRDGDDGFLIEEELLQLDEAIPGVFEDIVEDDETTRYTPTTTDLALASIYTVANGTPPAVVTILQSQDSAESEVRSIEVILQKKTNDYLHGQKEYSNLRFEKTVEALGDDSDEAESERESIDDVAGVAEFKDASHELFLEIEKLEAEREEINARRLEFLRMARREGRKNKALVSSIDTKVNLIEEVRTVAHHIRKAPPQKRGFFSRLLGGR